MNQILALLLFLAIADVSSATTPTTLFSAQAPTSLVSPDGSSVLVYTKGAINPNAGQSGSISLQSTISKQKLLSVDANTTGALVSVVAWAPDSKSAALAVCFGRGYQLFLIRTEDGKTWKIVPSPVADAQGRYLGDRSINLYAERLKTLTWTDASTLLITGEWRFKGGEKKAFSCNILFTPTRATTAGWKSWKPSPPATS